MAAVRSRRPAAFRSEARRAMDAELNAGFWFGQLFHLASHGFLVAMFYWAAFHFPARLKRPLNGKPLLVDGESVRVWRGVKDGKTNEWAATIILAGLATIRMAGGEESKAACKG